MPDPSDRRRASLQWLLQRLPPNPWFDQWLARTGELPPDFEALPSVPLAQDPLEGVKSSADWPAKRAQIAGLVEEWLLGHAPPAPGNVRGIIEEKSQVDGREVWRVRLEFGPDHAATFPCWFYPGKGPAPWPVFLSDNSSYINYGKKAAAEGNFALCLYGATDPCYINDKPDPSESFHDLFGPCDWSAFRRRGWCASRAIDWLLTLPEIDPRHVYIGGHSRSAKQAMSAMAFDQRIAGMIASSPGAGGSMAYRSYDQSMFGESVDLITQAFPDWVCPKVRFFAGREDRLPVDSHLIYALLAPRPVLMGTGINDWVEHTWAVEETYKLSLPVYKMLGRPENLGFRYREGNHTADAGTYEAYSDFLMLVSGQRGAGNTVAGAFPFTPYHKWDYAQWAADRQGRVRLPPMPSQAPSRPGARGSPEEQVRQQREQIRSRITWLLGDGPRYGEQVAEFGVGESDEVAKVLQRSAAGPLPRVKCRFGENIDAYLTFPSSEPETKKKLPAVVWLAPFHTSIGYTEAYRSGDIFHPRLAKAGFVTLCFDPIGTGARQEERESFFDRNPDWSLMGRMLVDARHAVDALIQHPKVDAKRIYLVGYALGGMVAAFTMAMDDRVAGAVSIAGFTPFRHDLPGGSTGGLRRWSHLNGWLPRLGAFVGNEHDVPVDFDEILACAAPRPMLVIAPVHDRHADAKGVIEAVEKARQTYGQVGKRDDLRVLAPDDWNRLTDARQDEAIEWLLLTAKAHHM